MLPTAAANINQIYHPSHGSVVAIPAITNFANPMQFICSSIQAGSRLGYQESAELCAQYLAPILDAIKFNYLPFGVNAVQHRRGASQGGRLLRAAAAAAQRVQGHHRPRDLGAGYTVVAPQHPARLDCRAGHARAAGGADHGGPDDPRLAGRTDGWPEHRNPFNRTCRPRRDRRTRTTRTRYCRPSACGLRVPIQPPPPGTGA